MEPYAPLLARTRLPQPSLQRYAVIQIFDKLRSGPAYLNPNSDPGRDAISQCLTSGSPSVVDQSVRELCRLVKDSLFDINSALLDLQSALEAAPVRLVDVFVKGIGFLVRFGFQSKTISSVRLDSLENHPFVKVVSCRPEVQDELLHQVILFVVHGEKCRFSEVCDYIRPLLTYSIVGVCSSGSPLMPFLSLLVSSLVSVWCSSLQDMGYLFYMLIGCLRCFSLCGAEDLKNVVIFAELLVDAHLVKLRRTMVPDAQLAGVKLLDALLTLCLDFEGHSIGHTPILRLSRRLISDHKNLGLCFIPELVQPVLSLFAILSHLELEDEKLFILDFVAFIIKWQVQADSAATSVAFSLCELQLFFFPVISLMSSPSKSVKQAASRFLLLLESLLANNLAPLTYSLSAQTEAVLDSNPEKIVSRLLQHLWLQDLPCDSFYLKFVSGSRHNIAVENGSVSWVSQLKEYFSRKAESQKSSMSLSSGGELISPEIPSLLGAVVMSLVMHPSLEISALDMLASLGEMNPKLGVSLLLGVLYYSNYLRDSLKRSTDVLLKLLRVLPSLASQSPMQPLVVQTILPMLHKDSNRILYATALRLLCNAWEMNDKVFPTLHVFLLPECFKEFESDQSVAISMAASACDICRQNPDRGLELILSISVCIESRDAVVQALGLRSLGFLCEADGIDFYSAWYVIANHVQEYLEESVVAFSLCTLLRWGAVDAEVYPTASGSVLQILWNIGSRSFPSTDPLWKKARITAFEAINHFEVSHFENSMPDLKVKLMELLVTETDVDILRVIGELGTRIIAYEHSTRRRLISEKKAPRSKLEKLLDVFPRVVFSTGRCHTQAMPGAALFSVPYNIKDANARGKFKTADDLFREYHDTVKGVSAFLYLSRNTLLAVLSLQSWKSLMHRWLKDYNSFLVKASSSVVDKTSKAANDILKDMIQLAEDSIPRVAENISLAIGAYCLILPASAHNVKVAASKFLLGWLPHHEHEHRQWSAAIAIGAISSCLHVTDRQQKLLCVNGLIEVACSSRSSLVKGACSIGLGYACQDLLTRPIGDEKDSDKGSFSLQEEALLGKIVRTLSLAICQVSKISPDRLESLLEYKASDIDYDYAGSSCESWLNSCDDVDSDIWGVAGLVLGLGMSVPALFRAGSYDTISNIKFLCASWVAQSLASDPNLCIQSMLLATGACLVLPSISSFCRKVDLMHDDELNNIMSSYEGLISKLRMVKSSNALYENLLTVSCVGGGALLASILDEGLFLVDVERVKKLLELFKTIYSGTYSDLVHLGAFLGVVNTLGADAGSLFNHRSSTAVPRTFFKKEESSYIDAPLLSSSLFVETLSGLMQDIFLVAQQSDATQLAAYAAWAISFLRVHLWSKWFHGMYGRMDDNAANAMPSDQSFSKDATVVKLTSWLTQLNFSKCRRHVNTVAAVLKCLSGAPRLPKLDYGAVVRRCIKYESHDSFCDKRSLLEECIRFSLAHASNFDSVLAILDDLTCLPRFRTLDIIMQSCIVFHLPDLMGIFSSSRNQQLLVDMYEFLSSPVNSYEHVNTREKRFLQLSFWRALTKCFDNVSGDFSDNLSGLEKCMEVLFRLLPAPPCDTSFKKEQMPSLLWKESMACLGNARQAWLMSLLQLSEVDEVQRNKPSGADLKKMLSLVKLVKIGSVQLTELGKLKSYMMCTKLQDMWDVLVEVVSILLTAEAARKQWLIEILEISCITKYPSTALHFIGLLSGSSCKYMPLLILDTEAVLLDLPVTLSSLLSSPQWQSVGSTAVSYLWASTERIYAWVNGDHHEFGLHPIDPTEIEKSSSLLNVMLDACRRLKQFLPRKNRLRLANMAISRGM